MLKEFDNSWDCFALFNNTSIDWEYDTFRFLKVKYLQQEDEKRHLYEKDRLNDDLYFSSLIGLGLSNRNSSYKYWLEKFETNPKFIIAHKVLQ